MTDQPGGRRLTWLSVAAVVLFALWGIGGPLLGRSVLASTDELAMQGPYVNAGLADQRTSNTTLDDTYTSRLPDLIQFRASLAEGTVAQWDPYTVGGSPLAAVPNSAVLSPLSLPYLVLPTWLAPGYEKLLEIICAVGGCVLFLRRLRLSLPAALAGGLVFASSAFMVVWLNFPQTQVAAFVPALFWTVERFLQTRRARDAALISLPVASMLLGGFPAVLGYALLTVAGYTVVRVVAEHRWRRSVALLAGTGLGVAAGFGLVMFQLAAFVGFYRTWLIEGREQTAADHLSPVSLVTAVAPWALGTVDPHRLPAFFLAPNLPEAMSYVGGAALVLVAVAVASARRGRAALPAGVWVFLLVATLVWAQLCYLGGPPLAWLQRLPVLRELFAGNYIGRSRSVLGFLLAIWAAVGLDLLLRRRAAAGTGTTVPWPPHRWSAHRWVSHRWVSWRWVSRRWVWPAVVGAGGLVVAAAVVWAGRRVAATAGTLGRVGAVHRFDTQLALGGVVMLAALGCVATLWWTGRTGAATRPWRAARFGAAALLPVLIAGQGLYVVRDYYPSSDRATFYPVTDTHEYLAHNLGQQRFAATAAAVVMGTNGAYRLRSVNGHAFVNDAFAQLVRGVGGDPIAYPTHVTFAADLGQATSPILDRLGTRYFLTSPTEEVFGVTSRAASDGTSVVLRPGQPVTVPASVTGRLRAVGFVPTGAVPPAVSTISSTNWVDVVVRDSTGAQVAQARRLTSGITSGVDFLVPVAEQAGDGEDDPGDDTPAAATVTLTLHAPAPLSVAAASATVAVSTVVAGADGLRLVYAGSSIIYQRLNAMPRIRWASRAVVETDQAARIDLLARGAVDADTVVLSAPGPVTAGQPAAVRVTGDGADLITTHVDAQGAGYLVVADADQTGWSATVDSRPVPLVAADQGLVAVAVPAGAHTVTLRFAAPSANVGGWISVATLFAALLLVIGDEWRQRRRAGGHRHITSDSTAEVTR